MARFSRERNIKGKRWTSNAGCEETSGSESDKLKKKCKRRSRVTKGKPGRQNWKKESLCRRQLWRWNDAWKNIILSLVSTQFVMSFTHSFNRLENEMSHKTNAFVCLSQGHPAKWQISTNDAIKATLNVPNSIEEKMFCCLQKKYTDNWPVGLVKRKLTYITPSLLWIELTQPVLTI